MSAASDVFLAVESYRLLAKQTISCRIWGSPKRAARVAGRSVGDGLGLLLSEGIGDTLRVSLAADPVEEIKVGFDILSRCAFARGITHRLPDLLLARVRRYRHGERAGAASEDIITPDGRLDHVVACSERAGRSALVSTLRISGTRKRPVCEDTACATDSITT